MNSDGYLPSREAAREISTTFNETELNNCSSIYYTDTQEISLFLLTYKKMVGNWTLDAWFCLIGYSEVNSTCYSPHCKLTTSAREALFTCLVYINIKILKNVFPWLKCILWFIKSATCFSRSREGYDMFPTLTHSSNQQIIYSLYIFKTVY